jgi:hypothetical protein
MRRKTLYLFSVVLILNIVCIGAAQEVDPNLLGWWKLDGGEGAVAYDSSGKENHGTIHNPDAGLGPNGSVWDFDDERGMVLSFNGHDTDGAYVDAGWIPAMTLEIDFTWTFWAKQHVDQNDLYDVILGNRFGGTEDPLQFIKFTPQEFEYYHRGGGPNGTNDVGTMDIEDLPGGVWIHQAVVKDGTLLTYYRNGVEADSIVIENTVDANPFYMAGDAVVSGDYHERWRGWLSDVRIYNRALNHDEVKQTMRGNPDLAWSPRPTNKAQVNLVENPLFISWSLGDKAVQQDVYFDIDEAAVENADITDTTGIYRGRQDANSYTPTEESVLGQTYYWRIDEVNDADPNSPWKGDIWSFTAFDYLIVEDFEDYNDYSPDRIFDTWIDGWGTTTNGATAGYPEPDFNADEHFVETNIVHSGEQSMPFFFDNDMKYSQVERSLSSTRDWTFKGVGELSFRFRGYIDYSGSFVEEPTGTYTMTGSGADIWNTSDQFHFVYRELSGAGSIIAKVESVSNTHDWAKAGVMIRDTLEPESAHVMMIVAPNQSASFQYRRSARGSSEDITEPNNPAPLWVRLDRDMAGNIIAYYSGDGSSWTLLSSDRINMGLPLHIGLVVTSHDASQVCEAVFSNVSLTGTVTDQWVSQDIGIITNPPQPMYVAVANAGGEPVVVYNEDPNATVIPRWTEFVVPLQDFADQGIDLTDVDNIAVGIGTKGNATTNGGSGVVYIDDIRLYIPRPAEEPGQ